jgi:hypothetical protein
VVSTVYASVGDLPQNRAHPLRRSTRLLGIANEDKQDPVACSELPEGFYEEQLDGGTTEELITSVLQVMDELFPLLPST